MPSGPLRRQLRGAGHHLAPVVQVGKEGVTPAVLRQLEQALLDHELVKVKVGTESPEDRFEAAERLSTGAGAQLAQVLGRTLLVYRRHPEKPRFEPRPPQERPAPPARKPAPPAPPARKPARPAPAARKPARPAPPARKPARPAPGRRPRRTAGPGGRAARRYRSP